MESATVLASVRPFGYSRKVFQTIRHDVHIYIYRPQRSCGQGNIFTPVCHSVHRGGLPQCMLGCHPPLWTRQTPPPRPGRHPLRPGRPPGPGRHPPWTRQTPPDQADTPPDQADTPPDQADPPGPGRPPPEADSRIRSTSGRYASYWNAFLLFTVWCRKTFLDHVGAGSDGLERSFEAIHCIHRV